MTTITLSNEQIEALKEIADTITDELCHNHGCNNCIFSKKGSIGCPPAYLDGIVWELNKNN